MLVAEVAEVDPSSLSDVELQEWVREARRAADRLDAVRLAVLGEWDARQVWVADGAANARSWMAHYGDVGRVQAARELKVAVRLRRHPVLAGASATGSLCAAKVALIAAAATDQRSRVRRFRRAPGRGSQRGSAWTRRSRWCACGR
jgi:hypothetical protein